MIHLISYCDCCVKLSLILFLSLHCTLLQIVHSSATPSKPTTHRQQIFRSLNSSLKFSSYFLSSSLLVSTRSSISKAAEISEQIRDVTFYEKFQYQKPSDILKYLTSCNIKDGDSHKVLESLDIFSNYYPMYKLSPLKAQILNNQVKLKKPKRILEIGTFFGYSALNMASILPTGSTITCIESNIENAKVAQMVLNKGLGESKAKQMIYIINDISTNVLTSPLQIQNLLLSYHHETLTSTSFTPTTTTASTSTSTLSPSPVPFDFIFLDHDKNSYLPDLKLLESNQLLADECTIIADNVIFPGVPDYLEYVGYHSASSSSASSRSNASSSSSSASSRSNSADSSRSSNINSSSDSNSMKGMDMATKNSHTSKPPPPPAVAASKDHLSNKQIDHNASKSRYVYETRLENAPFERVGFETNWQVADDAMSITTGHRQEG